MRTQAQFGSTANNALCTLDFNAKMQRAAKKRKVKKVRVLSQDKSMQEVSSEDHK
jgi:hypothetical protein